MILKQLRNSAHPRCDHREAVGHGLDHRSRQSFGPRGESEQVVPPKFVVEGSAIEVTGEGDNAGAERCGPKGKLFAEPSVADDGQPRVRTGRPADPDRVDQVGNTFVG